MPAAARRGDPTSHGSLLSPGPGSPNVLISGQPAWRAMSDIHACPMTTGHVPHGTGVVKSGSMTVLINGLPAVRMGDVIIEAGGPPNAITSGDPTVIIS